MNPKSNEIFQFILYIWMPIYTANIQRIVLKDSRYTHENVLAQWAWNITWEFQDTLIQWNTTSSNSGALSYYSLQKNYFPL